MFGFLTDAIDNAIDVGLGTMTGDMPTQRQVSKLISDGASVAAIAYGLGVSVDVVEGLLEDEGDC